VGIAGPNRSFELIAGDTTLDLVNTLDWRFRDAGPEELLESYGDLLAFAEQSGLLTPRQARTLLRETDEMKAGGVLFATRELREAAADVFYAALEGRSANAASIAKLEGCFKAAHAQRKLSSERSRLVWEWPAELMPELPLWQLALNAEALLTSDKLSLLRACAKLDCRWLFLDTSKNHTRRWCDMKVCGNRMKARRFKVQHRVEASA
jgi:predicted RNA-binding Zn ribbon-like protein